MNKLKERWNVTSNWQLVIIFIVFAITGSTAAYLSKPVTSALGITTASLPSITDTHEFVVPKSIPIILPILLYLNFNFF
jgi:hypothetical protein